jgi:hypothetical protein
MFVQKKLSGKPPAQRRPILGVGINDADYVIGYRDVSGKKLKCPYYSVWTGILERCFNPKFHAKRPTYKDCTLAEDWKTFSKFKAWMEEQDWQGKVIDKDLLRQGNKHYGPDTCIFVSAALNNLLTLRPNERGDLPLGVSKSSMRGYSYYVASCSFYGKQTRLGYFKTPEEAAEKYREAKLGYIQELAAAEANPRIKAALLALH